MLQGNGCVLPYFCRLWCTLLRWKLCNSFCQYLIVELLEGKVMWLNCVNLQVSLRDFECNFFCCSQTINSMHLVDTWGPHNIAFCTEKIVIYLNGCRPFETLSHGFLMSFLKWFRRTVAHLTTIKWNIFWNIFSGEVIRGSPWRPTTNGFVTWDCAPY